MAAARPPPRGPMWRRPPSLALRRYPKTREQMMVLESKTDRAGDSPSRYARRALKIKARPLAGALGAEILGPDLTRPLRDSEFPDVHQAFLDYLVVFTVQKKPITPDQQTAFAARLGEVDLEPFAYAFKLPTVPGYPQILLSVKEVGDRSFNVGGF